MAGDTGPIINPPGSRREARQFEPPPWERDAFEKLRLQQEEQWTAVEESPTVDQPTADRRPAELQTAERRTAESGEIDEALVEELLAGLAAQEYSDGKGVDRVSVVSALILLGVGTMLLIWGMAALVGSGTMGATGSVGGVILSIFGAGSMAASAWLVVGFLRRRGVL